MKYFYRFTNYLIVLPEQLELEYKNFTVEKTKRFEEMNKLKPGLRLKNVADAIYYVAYGIDIAAERKDKTLNTSRKTEGKSGRREGKRSASQSC